MFEGCERPPTSSRGSHEQNDPDHLPYIADSTGNNGGDVETLRFSKSTAQRASVTNIDMAE
jgi:hypothetical protein